jgi:hypothetical protein
VTGAPPLTFVTWFHADDPGHAGSYAQTLGDAGSTAHYETYLRCVDLCVASFRRWNAGPCLVVLNERARAAIDPARLAFWAGEDVEVVVAENRHLPAEDLYSRWQNQFFLFDVIRAAIERTGSAAPIAVVDSDCVVRGDLAPLAAAIVAEGRVAMTVGYEEDADIHGLTRRDLGRLLADRGVEFDGVPEYLGGEFVAGTASALGELLASVEEVYAWTLERRAAGEPHPNEEAHMISVAMPYASSQVTGNRFVERVWTQRWEYRAFSERVEDVPIWHLPAEKRTGIARLQRAARKSGWFRGAPREEWLRRVGDAVGVPRYGVLKAALDARALAGRVVPAVQRRVRRP